MRCPYCGHAVTSVIDSRLSQESNTIRRRRECESCKRRFTTLESADLSFPRVIKSDKSTTKSKSVTLLTPSIIGIDSNKVLLIS